VVLAAHIARVLFALGVPGVECGSIPSILEVLEEVILERLQQRLLGFWLLDLCETITVTGCSMGSGMMFVKLRGTRILTEGDSRFYTQPKVGRVNGGWLLSSVLVVSSECISIAFSECTNIASSTCMSIVT
jgi:hypothetical protein